MKEYGPKREEGRYTRNKTEIGVVIDTKVGELSFVLDGKECGVAYKGIPLDKPLVPCVLLNCADDTIELIVDKSK